MESSLFIVLFLLIFSISWILTPFWIKRAKNAGLVGKDIHKSQSIEVAEMGGIIVLLSFIIGIMAYIAMRVFLLGANSNIALILSILAGVLIAGIIGIIDDILGWKIGLKQWQKPLLTFLVAFPIMAVNAGNKIMFIPYLGNINFGILYPLLIIPLAIIIAANSFNMIAGYNGLETGLGIIIFSTLAYHSYTNNQPWVAVVAVVMIASLFGFLIHNKFPAKVFPGDTLTYAVGALCAMIAIYGNIEKTLIILFIPYAIEFFLKLRGRFKKESFAQVHPDQTLTPRYEKMYGLEHCMVKLLNNIKLKTTERKVVYSLYILELIFAGLTFII